MKTIQERAKEIASTVPCDQHDLVYFAYKKGAEDQDDIRYEERRKWCSGISLIHYLDEHRPKDKMCFSNMECADLEKAFLSNDWEKVIAYIHKYENPGDFLSKKHSTNFK